MKALVGTFNQQKALVGAFSVIVQLHRLIDLRHYSGPITNVEENEENPEDGELDPDSYGLDPQEKIDWSKLRTIFRYRPKTVDEEGYLSEEDIYNILIENKIHKDLASMLASMSLNVG